MKIGKAPKTNLCQSIHTVQGNKTWATSDWTTFDPKTPYQRKSGTAVPLWDYCFSCRGKNFAATAEDFLSGCCRFLLLTCPLVLVYEVMHVAKPDQWSPHSFWQNLWEIMLRNYISFHISYQIYFKYISYQEMVMSMRGHSEFSRSDSAVAHDAFTMLPWCGIFQKAAWWWLFISWIME